MLTPTHDRRPVRFLALVTTTQGRAYEMDFSTDAAVSAFVYMPKDIESVEILEMIWE